MAKNYAYLKKWDDYVAEITADENKKNTSTRTLLLPINIDIIDGKFLPTRMTAGQVNHVRQNFISEIPAYVQSEKHLFPNPEKMFKDYISYFKPVDGSEGPMSPTPLDLKVERPVWMMFNLPRKNWKFTKDRQYSTSGDADDQTRNIESVCTMDNKNILIVSNRCRCNPKKLKFNLHVTINQTMNGIRMKTPIIIDPGIGNGGQWP